MKKNVLMIIAQEKFRDEELLEPKKIFEQEDVEVTIASKEIGTAKGMKGAKIDVEMELSEVIVDDYDAIIFVGGGGAKQYFQDEEAHDIAAATLEEGKLLAAICIAPTILANAGLLEGKEATVFPGDQYIQALEDGGAEYNDDDVVIDGDIITASGPEASPEFAEKILEKLG